MVVSEARDQRAGCDEDEEEAEEAVPMLEEAEGLLVGLSEATRRAYLRDIAELATWCDERGIDRVRGHLSDRHVFVYLLGLVRDGNPPTAIRRRLAVLRRVAAASTGESVMLHHGRLARIEHQILDAYAEQPRVLVVSDDAVIRAGLRGVLTDAGAICWAVATDELDPAIVGVWDYILVWIRSDRASDRYGAITQVGELGADLTMTVPVVAIHATEVDPVVRLRLAEAGFRYLVPHRWLSAHLLELSDLLSTASIPVSYHLETPLAIRDLLGLRLSGELRELVEAGAALAPSVWRGDRIAGEPQLPRTEINRLRALALRSSGIPEPDFAKYATSMRRPPELPEWPRVRELLRQALGYGNITTD